jgi:hypothetical protein
MSLTTSLDDDQPLGREVLVTHYRPDFETLAEEVGNRAVKELSRNAAGCLYLNPLVTIRCRIPDQAFFKAVRRFQAQWCRRTKHTFPRRARRKVADWVGGGEVQSTRYGRFLDRSLCFTGVLFIDGRIIAPHDWPDG